MFRWWPFAFNISSSMVMATRAHLFTFLVHLGRHRCIGENFAFIQIKTIWSILLRKYEFDLADGHFPPVNYTTMIHTPTKPIICYKRRS